MKLAVTMDMMPINMLELQGIMIRLYTELILKCQEKDLIGSGSIKPELTIMIIKHSDFQCFTGLVLASQKRGNFWHILYSFTQNFLATSFF
jgi:hypothetical protein